MIQKEKDKPNSQPEDRGCLSLLASLLFTRRYSVHKFHVKVRKEVSKAIEQFPDDTTLVALESIGLPNGHRSYIWIELSPTKPCLVHKERKFLEADEEIIDIQLSQEQSRAIIEMLESYKIWELPHINSPIIDGFYGGIAIATHDKVHSTQMHLGFGGPDSPEHKYWELLKYLFGLSDRYANDYRVTSLR